MKAGEDAWGSSREDWSPYTENAPGDAVLVIRFLGERGWTVWLDDESPCDDMDQHMDVDSVLAGLLWEGSLS